MSDLVQLMYISNSTNFDDETKLQELLALSRKNNSAKGLTGMLLYHDQQFFQVLEGPRDAVYELYDIIQQDNRHRACRKMAVVDIEEREFPDWSMGYYEMSPEDSHLILGFNQFMSEAPILSTDKQESEAYKLLNKFKLRALESSGLLSKAS